MEKHTTTGLIMVKNKLGIEYKISKIEYTVYEDESFEYVFTPYYPVIDLLPRSLFQGIPGLDLDLRREKYIRKDIVPVFISERSPGPNREDLKELLAEVGMTYLNRLEWLIRTDYIYSGDPLYVIAYDEKYEADYSLAPGQKAISAVRYATEIISAISHGQRIVSDGRALGSIEIATLHNVLQDILLSNREMQKKNRQLGINKASSEGRSKGRKKIQIDDIQFNIIKEKFLSGQIGIEEAISKLGISRATFYRRLKES